MATTISHSPVRSSSNKMHLSPSRSSSSSTVLSSIMSQKKTASKKSAVINPQTPIEVNTAWAPPTPTIEASMSKTHHIGLEVSGLRLMNAAAKFNSSLMVKLTCEGTNKMLNQSGFTFSEGVAKFDIKENVTFATKCKVARIVVEVLMGNDVIGTGVMSLDIMKHLNCPIKNNVGELSRWNKFPLASARGGRHVQVTEIVGEIEAAFEVKGELYWSDSESGGTLTNSVATTPASTIGSVQSSQTPTTTGGITPKIRPTLGISPKVGFVGPPNQVLTPKQGVDKENASANKFFPKENKNNATSKSTAVLAKDQSSAPAVPKGVSLCSDMDAEAEAASTAVVAPVVAPVVTPVDDDENADKEVNFGRMIWIGIVLIHMFMSA